jgi:NAD+ synthase
MRDARKLVDFIKSWISHVISASGAGGAVIGLSGGIDSAVCAALLKEALGPERVITVQMPCNSIPLDAEHARLAAEALGLKMLEVDLSEVYDVYAKTLNSTIKPSDLAAANIKPRLRMITLYAIAQTRGYLVCGTGNKDELTVGYYTKFGDGGCDFMPLADLTKGEVRAVARGLHIPQAIIDKAPSAGLWEGQTDEKEMGLTYDVIDAYLSGEPVDEASRREIERRNKASEHKRKMPLSCVIGRI